MPRNRVIKQHPPRHRVQGMDMQEYIRHHKACLVAYAESRKEGANPNILEDVGEILRIEIKKRKQT